MYIDDHPYTHKKITGFINSSKGKDPTIRWNYKFVEVINDKYGDMERWVDRFIMVDAITKLTIGDELLIKYLCLKKTLKWKRREEEGLPKDVPKGRKPNNVKWPWLVFKTMKSKMNFISS